MTGYLSGRANTQTIDTEELSTLSEDEIYTNPAFDFPEVSADTSKKKPFLGFAFMVGANASTGVYNYEVGPPPPQNSILFSPMVGIAIALRFSKVFSLEANASYKQKGDRIDMNSWYLKHELPTDLGDWTSTTSDYDGFTITRVGYAEFSLAPTFHMSKWFQFAIGAYGAIGLHGSENAEFTIVEKLDDTVIRSEDINTLRIVQFADFFGLEDDGLYRYFNRFDYGLIGNVAFAYKPVRIEFGLSYSLERWSPEKTVFSSTPNPNKTQHLCASLGFKFWVF